MQPLSPSDYLPLDSRAPAVFRTTEISIYIYIAVAALVLYDHVITFDIEVERIWTLKWGLPKVLFLMSRYVIQPLLMLNIITQTIYPLPISFCKFQIYLTRIVTALSLFTVEVILIIRVSALYGHSRIITSFLAFLFTAQFAVVIVAKVITFMGSPVVLYYQFLPGCWFDQVSESAFHWSGWWRIAFVCSESILLILALVKAFSYRDHLNPMIRLLARDSAIYFAPMFACLVETVVAKSFKHSIYLPTEWIACIAISRMMLNLRSLASNDPLSTQRPIFSTIVFENRDRV